MDQDFLKLISQVEEIAKNNAYDPTKTALTCKKKIVDDRLVDAVEIILQRRKAGKILEWGDKGFFTNRSLQQSSNPIIANYHAVRFKGGNHILEICTGAGIDTIALASVAGKVTSVDNDPKVIDYAKENASILGIKNIEFVCAKIEDVVQSFDIKRFDGIWADPSRRDIYDRKINSPSDYHPSLEFILSLNPSCLVGIKLSPSYNFEKIPAGCIREWLGYEDECSEQVLWLNSDINADQAVLADINLTYACNHYNEAEIIDPAEIKKIKNIFLVEPHSTLIRSGKLSQFYQENNISLLDSKIAYGVAKNPIIDNPFFQSFKIVDLLPATYKMINSKLKELDWNNNTEIKKRGFSDTPEIIRRKLKFPANGKDKGVLFFTHFQEKHYVFLCQRL